MTTFIFWLFERQQSLGLLTSFFLDGLVLPLSQEHVKKKLHPSDNSEHRPFYFDRLTTNDLWIMV